jgi:hypothetical protein
MVASPSSITGCLSLNNWWANKDLINIWVLWKGTVCNFGPNKEIESQLIRG